MNIKIYKDNQNEENSQIFNDKKFGKNNHPGKILEKLIMLNEEKTIRNEKKIKDSGIEVIHSTANKIKVPKASNNSKVHSAKKSINNEPYLKPKFQKNNKNAISIKIKKKNKINNNLNEEINNIYLNFFKIYYDENGKKIKIIKNKSTLKKNKSKELLLTQKNIASNKILANKDNKGNNFNEKKLKKNCETENLHINSTKKADDNNIIEIKYHYPDTPSQSTTTENKSLAKSKSFVNNEEFINNKKKSLNVPNKEKIITDENNKNNNFIKDKIYDKENFKKIKKKNIVINNTNASTKIFFKKSPKKLKAELSQGLLMHQFYNNYFNINKSTTRERSLDSSLKNSMKDIIINDNKINYFHNNISNSSLSNTFEENNLKKNMNKNPDSSYIKKIHISSLNKNNIEKSKNNYTPFSSNNNLEKIEINNNNNDIRNREGFKENYLLFNFYKNKINRQSDKNFTFQKAKNFYSNFCSRNNSINEDSLSYNNYNIMKYNISNNLNANTYIMENENNILNKTKEILNMNQHKPINFNYTNMKNALFSHLKSNFDLSPKSIKFERSSSSTKNMNNLIINKNTMCTPNINYNLSSRKENECSQKSKIINLAQFNKIRRPCSLNFNKKVTEKEKINKTNINLCDYYSCAIDKDRNLNSNIKNISKSPRNIIFQFPNYNKNTFSEAEINYNINNSNLKNNKYININQSCFLKKIFNKKINQKKCNENQFFDKLSPNNSLKSIPSCLLFKKNNIN